MIVVCPTQEYYLWNGVKSRRKAQPSGGWCQVLCTSRGSLHDLIFSEKLVFPWIWNGPNLSILFYRRIIEYLWPSREPSTRIEHNPSATLSHWVVLSVADSFHRWLRRFWPWPTRVESITLILRKFMLLASKYTAGRGLATCLYGAYMCLHQPSCKLHTFIDMLPELGSL